MLTFLKSQAALVIGSFADFLLTTLLVEVFHCWYLLASAIGNFSGAITLFFLSRNWAFRSTDKKLSPQVIRFLLVWTGNILLAAGGLYGFTHFLGLHYLVSKLLTSVLLGITYNYLLQKYFVFA